MPTERESITLGATMVIELCNLRDTTTNALTTGATVTGQVLDSAGSPVGSVPNPITFTEVSGRSGLYRGEIPSGASVSVGDIVTVVVTSASGGATGKHRVEAIVQEFP